MNDSILEFLLLDLAIVQQSQLSSRIARGVARSLHASGRDLRFRLQVEGLGGDGARLEEHVSVPFYRILVGLLHR